MLFVEKKIPFKLDVRGTRRLPPMRSCHETTCFWLCDTGNTRKPYKKHKATTLESVLAYRACRLHRSVLRNHNSRGSSDKSVAKHIRKRKGKERLISNRLQIKIFYICSTSFSRQGLLLMSFETLTSRHTI